MQALLDRSTLDSLNRLAQKKLLSIKERDAFTAPYLFLRDVEHKLQMVHDLQTHSLPESSEELERCAVRMEYDTEDRTAARDSRTTMLTTQRWCMINFSRFSHGHRSLLSFAPF